MVVKAYFADGLVVETTPQELDPSTEDMVRGRAYGESVLRRGQLSLVSTPLARARRTWWR